MIFFDDADTVAVQHATASSDRIDLRAAAGRIAATAGAAVLMVVAVFGAVALTVALLGPSLINR